MLTRIPNSLLLGGGSGEGSAAGMGFINPEDYGMQPVGHVDANPTINAAALEAALIAGPVMIPPKPYKLDPIEHTGRIGLIGCGVQSNLQFVGSGSHAIHIPIPANNVGSFIGNFLLNTETPNGFLYGIHFEQTTEPGYMARWKVGNMQFGSFGHVALYLDNGIASGDGFFTGVIEECQMSSNGLAGIYGENIGDSILIRKNVINGGTGIALYLTQVGGARQVVIEDNNLTSLGPQMYFVNMGQTIAHRNWCEHPAYLGNFSLKNGLNAQIILDNCYMCDINYSTIAGGHGRPGPGGAPATGSAYGIWFRGTTQLSRCGPRNWISATSSSRFQNSANVNNSAPDNIIT